MAVLGVQIAITLIVASVMSKVGPYLSFARWLLTGSSSLMRYLHPSDEELRRAAMIPTSTRSSLKRRGGGGRSKKANDEGGGDGTFNVPRSLDLELETAKVNVSDIVQLRYYAEYQWLLDFALYSVLVYSLTELYICLFPSKAVQEINLSLVWCLLAVGFAYKLLASLTSLYFEGDEGGERALVIVMGFAYMFLAMMVLVVSEDTLETGLDEAYRSFNRSAASFLADNAGLDSSGPASKLVIKFCLALWCGSIGALFTFPGLRMARMHWDVLRDTDSAPKSVLLHATFVSPLLLSTLWVKPLSRDYLTDRTFRGMDAPLMTSSQFETLRLYAILAVLVLRLTMMPSYLQAYLNMARQKMEELKQEAGKISNVDLQRIVIRVFYYLCVVTLQYVAPMILILFLSFLYKTMGRGGSWNVMAPEDLAATGEAAENASAAGGWQGAIGVDEIEETITNISGQFSLAWQSLKHVFAPSVFRGIFGFSTWWCCLAWFTSAAFGISYQSYFAKV